MGRGGGGPGDLDLDLGADLKAHRTPGEGHDGVPNDSADRPARGPGGWGLEGSVPKTKLQTVDALRDRPAPNHGSHPIFTDRLEKDPPNSMVPQVAETTPRAVLTRGVFLANVGGVPRDA